MRRSVRSATASIAIALIASAAVGAGCGSPLSTAQETQTGAAGASATFATATAVAETATPTAQTTPAAAPTGAGTIVVTDLSRLKHVYAWSAISPDGAKILGRDSAGLEVGSADESGLQNIAPNAVFATWSPDSGTLAVLVPQGILTSNLQRADIVVMRPDGSGRTQLGASDFPRYVQFLKDGRLAFVRDAQLHLADIGAGTDIVEDKAAAIVNESPTPDVPFLVSEDGLYVATMHRGAISVQSLVTGESRQLTDSIDGRQLSGYGWSADGMLAYADTDSNHLPALHLFDPASASERVLLQGNKSGVFAGVTWSTIDWIAFVFYPAGTAAEELAEYHALAVSTGTDTLLFQTGIGLSLSGGGRKLIFARSDASSGSVVNWVATLAYQ